MVWSQFDRVVQMLQPVGLIKQVVVVEVELYSLTVQYVQMVVVVVEVDSCHSRCYESTKFIT